MFADGLLIFKALFAPEQYRILGLDLAFTKGKARHCQTPVIQC